VVKSVRPKPEKIVLNLTTSISNIKFNPTSEIVAMTSEVPSQILVLLKFLDSTKFTLGAR